MSPASKKEWAVVTECKTEIKHLEEVVRELKEELKNHKKEGVETQRYISNRKLAIYLATASILGGIVVKLLELLITKSV
jgi:DNA topoisomerase VI subunit B